jgi:hypothetical protein
MYTSAAKTDCPKTGAKQMNEKYQDYLDHVAKQAQGELESWGVKFAQNPLHQLEWADGVYSAGGKLEAVNVLMRYIDAEDFPDACMQTAVNSGRFAKSSSSPTGNLFDAHTRQWIAALAHDINSMKVLR